MSNYETVIGLEIHAELSTHSKVFCGCTTEFGGQPNTHCCPICTGMPGVLPSVNKRAVEYAIKAGLALNCNIAEYSKMDRKNYCYPDLPKAYQISQFDLPLCYGGYLNIEVDGQVKRIGINRIHLEEDAGKLVHDQSETESFVDYNRCGVPLIEIVTEPDMRSPEEGRIFLEKVKSILEYIEVSDCKMEEGSLRCDVNVSVRPRGQKEFGIRTEMKNLNSFRAAYRAMEYESRRHIQVLGEGGTIGQETRRWDDALGKSYTMRTKEEAQDYRYFPEPDLVPIVVDRAWVEKLKGELPELPDDKKMRYVDEYGLPEYDAGVLTSSKEVARFFEETVKLYDNPKTVSNWVMGDLLRLLKDRGIEMAEVKITPEGLIDLIKLVDKGVISISIGKTVFEEMFDTGKDAETIVDEKGLKQISDEGALREIVKDVLSNNPKSIEDYKAGKKKAMGYLVGQTMKATKGKANPQMVNKILKEELDRA
ncbi:Asp-tRNA(Asn)/Glu-tRNA(Gln) amidotransferase subunit GatB [Xylanivirga thermophila]|jgi:aspartyl-tRNA(Asn)/glutamyl-tRNA(Gln) amidotransferase subunit B|uniref:Asp-tRNA(Asn)/Glu-tRNA(Gln) amidotransferase subunit GatB n=1 Tax=Xylanivirga thermophila TaxID=2496273 RepID=UPI00101E206D|nr:Asp-tRNA(Asn)/Glu-tRNA(Gln) amidotransferase subunit GatB [Xylanivirga thermophila]